MRQNVGKRLPDVCKVCRQNPELDVCGGVFNRKKPFFSLDLPVHQLLHSNGMGGPAGIEVSPVSAVVLLSGSPFVSVELPIEALYLPDAAYRKVG